MRRRFRRAVTGDPALRRGGDALLAGTVEFAHDPDDQAGRVLAESLSGAR